MREIFKDMCLAFRTHGVGQKIRIAQAETILKFGAVCPSKGGTLGNIEKFARGAIGLGCIHSIRPS